MGGLAGPSRNAAVPHVRRDADVCHASLCLYGSSAEQAVVRLAPTLLALRRSSAGGARHGSRATCPALLFLRRQGASGLVVPAVRAVTTWLRTPFLGQPRHVWLLAAGVLVVWCLWVGWAGLVALLAPLSWLVTWLRGRRQADRLDWDVPDRPSPARDAQVAHSAAVEEARALGARQAASALREAEAVQGAETDPADEVAARVAARGRVPLLPTDPAHEARLDEILRGRRGGRKR